MHVTLPNSITRSLKHISTAYGLAGVCCLPVGWRHSLALQIGHRTSVDIAFFKDKEFDIRERQQKLLETLSSIEIVWQGLNGFSVQIDGVKIDIFNWRVPFTIPTFNVDGIRMMDKFEIGSMKLDVITTRKDKKILLIFFSSSMNFHSKIY